MNKILLGIVVVVAMLVIGECLTQRCEDRFIQQGDFISAADCGYPND